MDTPLRWNSSVSGEVGTVSGKWNAVRDGLRLVLVGYCVTLLLAGPGAALVWASQCRWSPELLHSLSLSAAQAAGVGWGLLAVGTVAGYLMLLSGQAQCLRNSSSRHGAKEFLFSGMLAGMASAVSLVGAVALGADVNRLLLDDGTPARSFLELTQGPSVLLLASALFLLTNFLLFTGFLRAVANCVAPSKLTWVASMFWVAVFLIGGTAGLAITPQAEVGLWLAAGWGVCWLWHALLVRGARHWIESALSPRGRGGAAPGGRTPAVEALLRPAPPHLPGPAGLRPLKPGPAHGEGTPPARAGRARPR